MPTSRRRKAKERKLQLPAQHQPQPATQSLHKRLLSRRAILVEVLSVGAVLLAYWGVYVETQPVILHGSSLSSPFLIKNPSSLFEMRDVVLTCQLLGTTWGGVPVPPGAFALQTLHAKSDGRIISIQRNVRIRRSDV